MESYDQMTSAGLMDLSCDWLSIPVCKSIHRERKKERKGERERKRGREEERKRERETERQRDRESMALAVDAV